VKLARVGHAEQGTLNSSTLSSWPCLTSRSLNQVLLHYKALLHNYDNNTGSSCVCGANRLGNSLFLNRRNFKELIRKGKHLQPTSEARRNKVSCWIVRWNLNLPHSKRHWSEILRRRDNQEECVLTRDCKLGTTFQCMYVSLHMKVPCGRSGYFVCWYGVWIL